MDWRHNPTHVEAITTNTVEYEYPSRHADNLDRVYRNKDVESWVLKGDEEDEEEEWETEVDRGLIEDDDIRGGKAGDTVYKAQQTKAELAMPDITVSESTVRELTGLKPNSREWKAAMALALPLTFKNKLKDTDTLLPMVRGCDIIELTPYFFDGFKLHKEGMQVAVGILAFTEWMPKNGTGGNYWEEVFRAAEQWNDFNQKLDRGTMWLQKMGLFKQRRDLRANLRTSNQKATTVLGLPLLDPQSADALEVRLQIAQLACPHLDSVQELEHVVTIAGNQLQADLSSLFYKSDTLPRPLQRQEAQAIALEFYKALPCNQASIASIELLYTDLPVVVAFVSHCIVRYLEAHNNTIEVDKENLKWTSMKEKFIDDVDVPTVYFLTLLTHDSTFATQVARGKFWFPVRD